MRGRAQLWLLAACTLFPGTNVANASCVDPMQLAQSTASIVRYFDDSERSPRSGIDGIRGTAWFLSSALIVTAEHVVAAMMLSSQHWKTLEIESGNQSLSIKARILRVAGAEPEKLAVIELQLPIEHARSVIIRRAPLLPEEHVMTITYAAGRPHPVAGRFVQMGDAGKLAGMALLEFYEGDNRLIIDHGASGAPVLDCEGRVAAVVSNVFTQNLQFPSRVIRISTAWGMPNVVSVPLGALDDLSQAN
jgi:Trypsin-like peptidase domain